MRARTTPSLSAARSILLRCRDSNYLLPFDNLAGDKCGEFGGRAGRRIGTERQYPVAQFRVLERSDEGRVELGNNGRGRTLRRYDAEPADRLEAGNAGFIEGRQLGHQRIALPRGNRERLDLPRLDQR